MQRARLTLEKNVISFEYSPQTKTLLIKYKKPDAILQREERERAERKTMGTKEAQDSNCNQQ
jgi:hypothetical protein